MAHALAAVRVLAARPSDATSLAVLDEIAGARLVARGDLVGVHGARPGSGRTDGEFWEGSAWFAKTRASRRYADVLHAIAELDRLYEIKLGLGALTPAGSVLTVVDGPRGIELWTIAPRLTTLRERLDSAAAAARWDLFAQALAGFARGLGEAIACSIELGLGLDANPANFAVQGGRLRYIDDDVIATRAALGVEDAFVARIAEYAAAPAAVWRRYADQFADEIVARLAPERQRELGLGPRLVAAGELRPGVTPLVRHVLERLGRAR
jgi:hypothetical protein